MPRTGRSSGPPAPPLPLCAHADPTWNIHKATLTWKGEKRVYTVHAQPGYTRSEKLPLVIAMHPYPADGAAAATISGLSAKADKRNFLVAYPDGLNQAFNALICCGTEDDVGFIRTITKRLTSTWNADPDRAYATGISNGGDMSFKLAVELPDTFAAIAPVSGGYLGPDSADDSYMPKTPASVITFIGGLDEHYAGMDEGITAWQKRLSCKTGQPEKLKKKTKKQQPSAATARTWSSTGCPTWATPGRAARAGSMSDPTAGINATDLMWEFFKSHTKEAP